MHANTEFYDHYLSQVVNGMADMLEMNYYGALSKFRNASQYLKKAGFSHILLLNLAGRILECYVYLKSPLQKQCAY